MAFKDTVKEWFKTGFKPTQAQFYSKFDFLRWKDEKIQITDIEGIEGFLDGKADADALSGHLISETAHANLFANKEDKTQKGVANGYAPLNEVAKIAITYLNAVNDLVTGGADAVLTAEQGKQLQLQINAINAILSSDDIDFDTLQEIVNAIKDIEGYLGGILVNDLTTGGTTKALTAEMGKTLKGLIDDVYQPNVLIASVPPTRVTNTFTYPSLQYDALINKVRYKNAGQFQTTIGVAADGFKRTDLIYITTGGVIGKKIGAESTTVAVRPDLSDNEVAISFINVFGASISEAIPVANEISVQDPFGTEKFKIKDYVRFEGVSFNPAQKLITIDPLVPLSAFLDIVNGNDVTGTIENSRKPFKTINALFNALPPTNGESYTVYITGGVVLISRKLELRAIRFIAYTTTTLDFTNCMESDGVTHAVQVLYGSIARVWNFENQNINIICNYIGDKSISGAILTGKINVFNWAATGQINIGGGSNLEINELRQHSHFSYMMTSSGVSNLVVNNFYISNRHQCFSTSIDIDLKNIRETYIEYNSVGLIIGGRNLKIGNLFITNRIAFQSLSIEFYGSTNATTIVDLKIINTIKGVIKSTLPCQNTYGFFNQTFENFTGKLGYLSSNGLDAKYTFINCVIEADGFLFVKGINDPKDIAVFFGSNTLINSQPNSSLVGKVTHNPPTDGYANIKINGALTTNMVSFGENVTAYYGTATFKEKLNEIVIRSKKDLVNRVLKSDITYVIDGLITLVAGDFILIPIGGLTFGGYGFDVSQIIKNVPGQSIFKSPVGGSGNFVSHLVRYNSGAGSVFDIVDADGTHAIEVNDINFQDCASLGKIKGYRQVTGQTIGMYGCSDGLIISGAWNGFVISKLHVRNFASTGTLFKKDTDTTFSNRFSLGVNISGNSGFKIADFDNTNFTKDETFQLDDCTIEVDGVISATNTPSLIPNISPNDPKCRWVNSTGIQLSAVKFQDLKSPDGDVWRLAVDNSGNVAASRV